jgi:NDP-sugar pyrophosphorylase family protein
VHALVLAAGLGTRLDPLTRLVAKPAVPLGSTSLVERVLDWTRRQGVSDVVVNLHHKPETVTGLLGDGSHLGLRVRYSWESQVLGSAGGPRHALPLLGSDPFAIVNGDTLADVDLAAIAAAHRVSGALVTMAVVPNAAPDRYNGLQLDAEGRVTAVVPRGKADGTWHFVGVQVASRQVFASLPDGVPIETVAGIYPGLIAAGTVRAWPAAGAFHDVGTVQDYLRAAAVFQHATSFPDCVIWPDAAVDPGAQITACIVAGPVRIPARFRASHAVIVPAALLRDGDRADVRDDVAVFPYGAELTQPA